MASARFFLSTSTFFLNVKQHFMTLNKHNATALLGGSGALYTDIPKQINSLKFVIGFVTIQSFNLLECNDCASDENAPMIEQTAREKKILAASLTFKAMHLSCFTSYFRYLCHLRTSTKHERRQEKMMTRREKKRHFE